MFTNSVLLNIFLFGYSFIFIALHAAILFGHALERLRDKKIALNGIKEAKVSIIIPIHNESLRMKGLLRTLLEQSYNFQIIFIDDRSADESPCLLAKFAQEAADKGIDCQIITLSENPGPNCKQYALCKGIEKAGGDYFLFTDGDCLIPPDWVKIMTTYIQDEKTGAAIAPVFKKKENKGFLYFYQCYDHVIRYHYLAGSTGLGAAGGGFGNNMIVKKIALKQAGGYESIPPSPTEDAALISKIRQIGKFKIRSFTNPDAAVETESEKTWKSFISQTLRWNNGGLFSPEPVTRFDYNLLMIIIGAGILAIPFLPFFPVLWPLPASVILSMIANTIITLCFYRTRMPRVGISNILGYLLALIFTPAYLTLMTIMGYMGIKPKWKN